MTALAAARHSCRVAVRDQDLDSQQRRQAVWEAFEACAALSHEVTTCAPRHVVKPADDSFRLLRDLRDAVADGFTWDSDPYVVGRLRYE
ncbi:MULTISPECIES: hypothetical protein [unclassified Streptomyces]|uniref:hypothetical protein n=1 Tax=unclassified Streptomyces TaxID=2593676 RepID=UPI002E1605ED|nr:hypothetical protein OG458_05055 [Streptomyces sp. NBC_01281]